MCPKNKEMISNKYKKSEDQEKSEEAINTWKNPKSFIV